MRSYRTFLKNQLSITSNGCTHIFDFSFYYSDVHIVKKPNSAHDNIHVFTDSGRMSFLQHIVFQLGTNYTDFVVHLLDSASFSHHNTYTM